MTYRHLAPLLGIVATLCLASCGNDVTVVERGPWGTIHTWAGTGLPQYGPEGGHRLATALYSPMDVAFAPDGTPWILDWNNHRVLSIGSDGTITRRIGTGQLGNAQEGLARDVGLNHPTHVSFDPQGRVILSAWHNSQVMRYDPTDESLLRVAGVPGNINNRLFGGDGGPAVEAFVNLPVSTAFDSQGRLYIADQQNQRIRRVDPVAGELTDSLADSLAERSIIRTVAGEGTKGYNGDGAALDTWFNAPGGQEASPMWKLTIFDDEVYFADTANNIIRKLTADGQVTTVAGGGNGLHPTNNVPLSGHSGDGGPATDATLSYPCDLAFDSEGNMYIADYNNYCVRKVDTNGIISTFAGAGPPPLGTNYDIGDGGDPRQAYIFRPWGVAVDAFDNVYIADTLHHRIRVVPK